LRSRLHDKERTRFFNTHVHYSIRVINASPLAYI